MKAVVEASLWVTCGMLILLVVHLHEHQETVHRGGQGLNQVEIQAVENTQKLMIEGGWLIVQPNK